MQLGSSVGGDHVEVVGEGEAVVCIEGVGGCIGVGQAGCSEGCVEVEGEGGSCMFEVLYALLVLLYDD